MSIWRRHGWWRKEIVFIQADLRHAFTLALPDDCEACFHLAAICREPGFRWDEYYAANHVGTRNLCAALESTKVNTIVFASTMMVYRPCDRQLTETAIACPDTAYGMSKLLAEEVLAGWVKASAERRLRIIRSGVVFGSGEGGNFTRLYRALRRNLFCYVGRRTTIKGSIYVKDLVRCFEFVMKDVRREWIVNAVFPVEYTIEDICSMLTEVFGMRRLIPTIPYSMALSVAWIFTVAGHLGLNTGIHYRRIQKLYYSTNLSAQRLCAAGFHFRYTLKSAIADWKAETPNGRPA